jgi:predicted  nucleic acid-binding Zn-ribbon protein
VLRQKIKQLEHTITTLQVESNSLRDDLEQSMARELQLMDQLRRQPLEVILQSKNAVIEQL